MRSSLVDTLWTVGLLLAAGGLIVVWAQCRYLLPATHFLIFLVPSCVWAQASVRGRRRRCAVPPKAIRPALGSRHRCGTAHPGFHDGCSISARVSTRPCAGDVRKQSGYFPAFAILCILTVLSILSKACPGLRHLCHGASSGDHGCGSPRRRGDIF